MDDIPNDLPARVAVLEEIARGTKAVLDRIERRLDTMSADHRSDFDRIERRLGTGLDNLGRRLDSIATEQRSDFRWLLGMMIGMGTALLGVMARGFHWL